MNNAKKTMPTRSLLQGGEYVNAASTCLRTRFAAIKAEQAKKQAPNVSTLRRKAK